MSVSPQGILALRTRHAHLLPTYNQTRPAGEKFTGSSPLACFFEDWTLHDRSPSSETLAVLAFHPSQVFFS
jgi:hypothetical protein